MTLPTNLTKQESVIASLTRSSVKEKAYQQENNSLEILAEYFFLFMALSG